MMFNVEAKHGLVSMFVLVRVNILSVALNGLN